MDFKNCSLTLLLLCSALAFNAADAEKSKSSKKEASKSEPVPCTCGIFLSGQFKKASREQPKEEPVLSQQLESYFARNSIGQRQCATKCLETIIKHLPKSADIICATLNRDCHKEKAYLFTKNYDSKWINSNMSAGREYCCKDNVPYKCPVV